MLWFRNLQTLLLVERKLIKNTIKTRIKQLSYGFHINFTTTIFINQHFNEAYCYAELFKINLVVSNLNTGASLLRHTPTSLIYNIILFSGIDEASQYDTVVNIVLLCLRGCHQANTPKSHCLCFSMKVKSTVTRRKFFF